MIPKMSIKRRKLYYEQWTDIPGYEGLYAVRIRNNFRRGEILAYAKKARYMHWPEKIKKSTIDKDGYARVSVCKDGIQYSAGIHRFVAMTFIPNPKNKPHVNHLRGNKLDNRPHMLAWATNSENDKHAYEIGLKKPQRGRDHAKSNIIIQTTIDGKFIKEWPSAGEIERILGFHRGNIMRAVRGIWSQSHGFKWILKK